jgi:hypothetical protein
MGRIYRQRRSRRRLSRWPLFRPSGQVTVAAGLGANVLVGGSNRTVALQPVSVDSSVGLNLAVGVAELHLRPGPP